MKTIDLIKMLQVAMIDHEAYGGELGEHEVYIDIYDPEKREYLGISPDIHLEYTVDGVYPILAPKRSAGWYALHEA
jgi:hypothetical protein